MFTYVFYIIIIILIIYMIKNHVSIKFKTFFKKGYKAQKNAYGIYCYWNKQGSSKTQSCVSFLLEHKNIRVYANLKSLKGIEYYYFSGFKTLLEIGTSEHDCIIFYDELFKGLFKGKKMTQSEKEQLMDFMSQMRKRNIIFLTTAQEWLEIPIEFRRYVRYDIKCKLKSFFGYPIIIKEFNDTEQIHWDNLENEYVSPRIKTIIQHGLKKVVNSYDTFEEISSLENKPVLSYNEFTYNDYIIPNFSSSFADILGEEEEKTAIATTTTNSNCCVSVSKVDFPLFDNENSDTPPQELVCQECQSVSDDDSDKSILIDDEFWTDLTKNDIENKEKND